MKGYSCNCFIRFPYFMCLGTVPFPGQPGLPQAMPWNRWRIVWAPVPRGRRRRSIRRPGPTISRARMVLCRCVKRELNQ